MNGEVLAMIFKQVQQIGSLGSVFFRKNRFSSCATPVPTVMVLSLGLDGRG